MGHTHGSLNCPDCSSMGIRPRIETRQSGSTKPKYDDRLSTAGFEHVYGGECAELTNGDGVDALAVVTVSEGTNDLSQVPLHALARAVEEQGAMLANHVSRLEGASYRIGYLEAMVSAKEEQLRLLPDLRVAAAKALTDERRSHELEDKLSQVELELANLKGAWWYRVARWLFGQ